MQMNFDITRPPQHARCGQRANENVRDTRALVAAACAMKGTELPSLSFIRKC